MEYLFSRMKKIESFIDNKALFLFLDFDGTLARIASTPGKASLSLKTKRLIRDISKCKNLKVAVISGRSLKDLKSRIVVKDVIYAGNHGLEIKGPKISSIAPLTRDFKSAMGRIVESLRKRLKSVKGVIIEDKILTISLHYRLVRPEEAAKVKSIFYEIVDPYAIRKICRVTSGKKVFEVRPAIKGDKGEAVMWLLTRYKTLFGEKALPIYIGDDHTDEDAFKKIAKSGISVMVGRVPDSTAKYYVKNVSEVYKFLGIILKMRRR